MQKPLFLLNFDHMSGVYTSLLDSWRNVSRFMEADFLFVAADPSTLVYLYEEIPSDVKIVGVNKIPTLRPDICVVSSYYFKQLATKNLAPLPIKPKRWIILDSTCLIISEYRKLGIVEYIKENLEDYLILGNNFNSRYFPDTNYRQWYHKFDWNRVDKKAEPPNGLPLGVGKKFGKGDYSKIREEKPVYPLSFSEYHYRRWVYITDGFFWENIGKLIFEMMFLNRPVYYSTKFRTMADGLTEYLRLFGIDDTIDNQILKIPKEELLDKLGFHENDLLLELIS